MACEYCDDGDDRSIYPIYGVAPHDCFFKIGKNIGESRLHDQTNLPENFVGDKDTINDDGLFACGTYTHCLECGAGLDEAGL